MRVAASTSDRQIVGQERPGGSRSTTPIQGESVDRPALGDGSVTEAGGKRDSGETRWGHVSEGRW
jgi:hypothetical protein